jgi:hypothetical protein
VYLTVNYVVEQFSAIYHGGKQVTFICDDDDVHCVLDQRQLYIFSAN